MSPPDSQNDRPPLPARKPAGMPWESFVDRKIREAEEAGQFDNLPGQGRPIPGIDDPPDDDWWLKQKLREEGLSVVPPLLEARLARERVLEQLPRLLTEAEVRRRLDALNAKINAAIASPAPGPSIVVLPVDVEGLVANWRAEKRNRRSAGSRG